MIGPRPAHGRRSRSWSVTGGRVQDLDDADIRLDTHVLATASAAEGPPAGSRYGRIVRMCSTARAVAELAAHLRVPVGVAGAMVAELRAGGWVETRAPLDMTRGGVVTEAFLRKVRDRLRAI
ncbi:DUF742 domain-containing protein [Streptomyces sp. NPDC059740]|uniref:DUF742 domain-containing protein n=1 Tax=Streptomyces sp. NPDC059740 TaxID=3346926 RepID=UPI0036651E54